MSYKTPGKPLKFDENMRLPPLNCKPVFNDVANNTTLSNIELPSQGDQFRSTRGKKASVHVNSSRNDIMAEIVPATAVNNQSQPVIDLHPGKSNKFKLSLKKKQSEASPSEFAQHLTQLKTEDDNILKAMETSSQLLAIKLNSSRHLGDDSTRNTMLQSDGGLNSSHRAIEG